MAARAGRRGPGQCRARGGSGSFAPARPASSGFGSAPSNPRACRRPRTVRRRELGRPRRGSRRPWTPGSGRVGRGAFAGGDGGAQMIVRKRLRILPPASAPPPDAAHHPQKRWPTQRRRDSWSGWTSSRGGGARRGIAGRGMNSDSNPHGRRSPKHLKSKLLHLLSFGSMKKSQKRSSGVRRGKSGGSTGGEGCVKIQHSLPHSILSPNPPRTFRNKRTTRPAPLSRRQVDNSPLRREMLTGRALAAAGVGARQTRPPGLADPADPPARVLKKS